jgi:hypothetical protein
MSTSPFRQVYTPQNRLGAIRGVYLFDSLPLFDPFMDFDALLLPKEAIWHLETLLVTVVLNIWDKCINIGSASLM